MDYKIYTNAELVNMLQTYQSDIFRRAGVRTRMQAQPEELTKGVQDPIARAAMAHRVAASQADGLAMFEKLDQEATQAMADIRSELRNRGQL